ncbi:MAG: AAA family ATPase, partial [bacterium]|nr:AAA family ATPase [bacterium]
MPETEATGPPPTSARVILSYPIGREPERSLAAAITESLREQGHTVLSDQDVPVGVSLFAKVEAQIRDADYLVVLLSETASRSEFIEAELRLAHAGGGPKILPIRVGFDGPLNYVLNAYLGDLAQARWGGESDTPKVLQQLKEAIAGRPMVATALPLPDSGSELPPPGSLPPVPGGMMAISDPFYVARDSDQTALLLIRRPGQTIVISGPGQIGKSSLLARVVAAAGEAGKRVALVDFSLFDRSTLENGDLFFRRFASATAEALAVPADVATWWDSRRPSVANCTHYFEDKIIKKAAAPLTLALDEVDEVVGSRVFDDFFRMLRAWHDRRAFSAFSDAWEQLDIVLATSVQTNIASLEVSPFNVGVTLTLNDFLPAEVEELNRRPGSPLSPEEIERLFEHLGGHPFLTRAALYAVSCRSLSLPELFSSATEDTAPFADHLRHQLLRLHSQPELEAAFRDVLEDGRLDDPSLILRLEAAGLAKRKGRRVVPRCRLYANYFGKHLLPSPQPISRLTLERMEIRNFKNIEHLELDFTGRSTLEGTWTCIAGINGSGKTSILQAICILLLGRRRAAELGEERLRQTLRRVDGNRREAELKATLRDGDQVHTLYLPLNESGVDEKKLRSHPDSEAMEELWHRLGSQLLVSYGATRNLSHYRDTRYEDSSREVQRQMTLFDPLSQIAAVDVLLEGGEAARPCLRTLTALLDTVLKDNDLGLTVDLVRDRLVFRADGASLGAIDLPDGFRALVAWLAGLCTARHQTPGVSTRPADITGIVLLDEIDLHLHPAFQRSLVPRLRAALPNVQWIVTTHSPLILSSFDRAELVLLD